MPGTSKAKNPRGVEITFTEYNHAYISMIDGKEFRYVSGTQFLKNYFPVFDPDGKIAERKAKQNGITKEEQQRIWREKGKASTTFGTRVHETIEDTINKNTLRNSPVGMKEEVTFRNAVAIGEKLRDNTDVLGVEKIVFDDRLGIAGTIDLFVKSRKDGSYVIIDHKTNEKIDTDNRWGSYCNDPISHVPAINFHEYALQLNLYGYLLKYGNYIPEDATVKYFLNHVTESGVRLMQLPDYQKEIKMILDDYQSKRN